MLEQNPSDIRASAPDRVAVGTRAPAAPGPEGAEWVLRRLERLLRLPLEPELLARLLLVELVPLVGAERGAAYLLRTGAAGEPQRLVPCASLARGPSLPERLSPGEGHVGACAIARRKLVVEQELKSEPERAGTMRRTELVFVPIPLSADALAVVELEFVSGRAAVNQALLDRLMAEPAPAAAGVHSEPPPLTRPPWARWCKLSHELRSPLSSVLVLSRLLSENGEGNLSPKQVAFAQAIHSSGNGLLALVNGLSELAKVEEQRLLLEPGELRLEHFRAHLEQAFASVARQRGLEFSVELGSGLPEVIVTDARRLWEIMKHVLGNAFGFTESGSVRVCVRAEGAASSVGPGCGTAAATLVFEVSDTGVGLTRREQRNLFEAFTAEPGHPRRADGVSGIGLAISCGLARLLGGDLRVSSDGSGCTFALRLPSRGASSFGRAVRRGASDAGVDPASRPPASVSSTAVAGSQARGALSGLQVLLVEDDVRSAFVLTGLLERQGAVVCHASGVGEALDRISRGVGASVLLIDGPALASAPEEALRRCGALPIVALTRPDEPEASELSTGVQRLPRPVQPERLLQLLREIAPAQGPAEAEASR